MGPGLRRSQTARPNRTTRPIWPGIAAEIGADLREEQEPYAELLSVEDVHLRRLEMIMRRVVICVSGAQGMPSTAMSSQ